MSSGTGTTLSGPHINDELTQTSMSEDQSSCPWCRRCVKACRDISFSLASRAASMGPGWPEALILLPQVPSMCWLCGHHLEFCSKCSISSLTSESAFLQGAQMITCPFNFQKLHPRQLIWTGTISSLNNPMPCITTIIICSLIVKTFGEHRRL